MVEAIPLTGLNFAVGTGFSTATWCCSYICLSSENSYVDGMVFIPTLVLNLHPNYKSNKGNLLRFFSHAICVFTVTGKQFVDRTYSLFIEAIFPFDEKSEHEV